jgi:hypothetical protein
VENKEKMWHQIEMEKLYEFHSFILVKSGYDFSSVKKKVIKDMTFEHSFDGQTWVKHPDVFITGQEPSDPQGLQRRFEFGQPIRAKLMRFYVGENTFADGNYMARFEYEVSLAKDQEVPPPLPAEEKVQEIGEEKTIEVADIKSVEEEKVPEAQVKEESLD